MTSPCTTPQDTPLPSPMWPVDYILNSAYSPLLMEQRQPKRQWRDAFEDLLAIEANGEMISLESRQQETKMALKIRHGMASNAIHLANRGFRDYSRIQKQILEAREQASLRGDTRQLSRLDDEFLPEVKTGVDRLVKGCKAVSERVEADRHLPASQQKQRGPWIASLISSGALPGWSSRYEACSRSRERRISMRKLIDPRMPLSEKDHIAFTENQLWYHFAGAKLPDTEVRSANAILQAASLRSDEVTINEDRYAKTTSSRPSPRAIVAQTTTAERILLPDGSLANKVTLTNHSENGKEESIEIVQDAAKVLHEFEKARMLMIGLSICW